jgi:Domain of Unknown Function (DUF1540)
MKKISVEMPLITKCMASDCAYNVNSNCHARAITVGDSTRPHCDTFLSGSSHIKQVKRIAGIGACKTASCKFNEDLECVAENIQVGMIKSKANCITFALN